MTAPNAPALEPRPSAEAIRRRITNVLSDELRTPVELITLAKLKYSRDLKPVCELLVRLVAENKIDFRQVSEPGCSWPGFRRKRP